MWKEIEMIAREPFRPSLPERTGAAEVFDREVGDVLGDRHLVRALFRAISSAIAKRRSVHLVGATPIEVFRHSLQATLTKIETQQKRLGVLRRLLGAADAYNDIESGQGLTASDCESSINFIYYSMVNRFQGEIAELLAVEPVLKLVARLRDERMVSKDAHVYWAETIQERVRPRVGKAPGRWAKGADGLIVSSSKERVDVHAIVEVKSMCLPQRVANQQIERHASRLKQGLRLDGTEIPPKNVHLTQGSLQRITVVPAAWKLSRRWRWVLNAKGDHSLHFPDRDSVVSPEQKVVIHSDASNHLITLGWSEEALAEAAYDLTFWYMQVVGRSAYADSGNLPKDWEMTPEDAGRNAIKAALYYLQESQVDCLAGNRIKPRQASLAARLYQVYGFGYAIAADTKDEGWREFEVDPPNTKDFYDQALARFQSERNIEGIANALCRIAALERRSGNLKEAQRLYREALSKFEETGDRLSQAKLLACIGDVSLAIPDGESACEAFRRSLWIYEGLNHKVGVADSLIGLGNAEGILDHLDSAEQCYRRAHAIAKSAGELLGTANAAASLADLMLYLRDYTSAVNQYREALPIYRQFKARQRELKVVRSLGEALWKGGELESGRAQIVESISLANKRAWIVEEAEAWGVLGDLEKHDGSLARAREAYSNALGLFRATEDLTSQGYLLIELGKISEALKSSEATDQYRAAVDVFSKAGHETGRKAAQKALAASNEECDSHPLERTGPGLESGAD
jgi:tetratricopeptide (TPR) repeat protein